MTQHPHRPDHIRVIVEIDDDDRRMVADFPVRYLPEWLNGMNGLTPVPLPKGTVQGALHAREIFRVSVNSDYSLMACLTALWICLYGPGLPPGGGLTLDDIEDAAGNGTLTIRVNGNRTRWEYLLTSTSSDQGGYKTVADLDFVTMGNA